MFTVHAYWDHGPIHDARKYYEFSDAMISAQIDVKAGATQAVILDEENKVVWVEKLRKEES